MSLDYLSEWIGKYKILHLFVTLSPDWELYTDASSLSGFGIYLETDRRKMALFLTELQNSVERIISNLFVLLTLAVSLWQSCNRGHIGRSSPAIMLLLPTVFYRCKNERTLNIKHKTGTDNSIENALSRLRMVQFFGLAQHAERRAHFGTKEAFRI